MRKYMAVIVAGIMSLLGCGTKAPDGDLLSLEYTLSGTMAGYEYEGRVEQDSTGSFVLTAMKESYGPLFQKTIGKSETDRFQQVILEEKMYRYKEAYRPTLQVLDGYSWTFHASFSDGSKISSHGSNARPSGKGLDRIRDLLRQLIEDADSIVPEKD